MRQLLGKQSFVFHSHGHHVYCMGLFKLLFHSHGQLYMLHGLVQTLLSLSRSTMYVAWSCSDSSFTLKVHYVCSMGLFRLLFHSQGPLCSMGLFRLLFHSHGLLYVAWGCSDSSFTLMVYYM